MRLLLILGILSGSLNEGFGFMPSRITRKTSRVTTQRVSLGSDRGVLLHAKKLGLLTFDLDDTLYPVENVIEAANKAMGNKMASFGYVGVTSEDFIAASKAIEQEQPDDVAEIAPLTYEQILNVAIRRELVRCLAEYDLQQVADAVSTTVSALHPIIVKPTMEKASNAVDRSVVEAVYNAWETERHKAAEENLYPEVVNMFKKIKEEHPEVIIGAVTNGAANPLKMKNTIGPFFDFCVSWGDDEVQRKPDFRIYETALKKYKNLATGDDADIGEACWIHVGDDLAYDVGLSAASGAKTIWTHLAEEYGQTAMNRMSGENPAWSTASEKEIKKYRQKTDKDMESVDEEVATLEEVPTAILRILGEKGSYGEAAGEI